MSLPASHSQRFLLANEVHARPHEPLQAPERASYVALLVDTEERSREHAHVSALCERYGVQRPPEDAIYYAVNLGPFRLRWERHTEFSAYAFFRDGADPGRFADPAIRAVPADWLAAVPGKTLAALHAELIERGKPIPAGAAIAAYFEGNYVVGSAISGGAAAAFTDFRVHADGFSRVAVFDREMSRYQAGRSLQRLFEIETYRMMALLALPIARSSASRLQAMEREVARVASALAAHETEGAGGDEELFEQLTRLAANVESAIGESRYRFGATRAYYEIVTSRVAELRESRLPGTQTIAEFMSRRLAPAMATCDSAARRLIELSERVAQVGALLATRVGVVRERQNQQLLASMERRTGLQLRLQETVEGLSVAAITYYVVGLIGYGAKAMHAIGREVDVELVMGISIPIVAVLVAFGARHVRRRITRAG